MSMSAGSEQDPFIADPWGIVPMFAQPGATVEVSRCRSHRGLCRKPRSGEELLQRQPPALLVCPAPRR
jgi:hypothetical protein